MFVDCFDLLNRLRLHRFAGGRMASKGRMFAGVTVALVTPFRDGEVDYQTLRDLVEWQVGQGTPVISPVGTTGECPTLSHDEHERVIATVVEQARGRARVMAGTG